jgi:hypothetical protein
MDANVSVYRWFKFERNIRMFGLPRLSIPRWLSVALGVALIAMVLRPSVSSAAIPQDTVSATGTGSFPVGSGGYFNIAITAQSGPSGENASGTAAFNLGSPDGLLVSGPVTCLSVTGPDRGVGTPETPTTAVLNLQSNQFGVVTVKLVDNGGNGTDVMSALPELSTTCSLPFEGLTVTLTNGRAVIFDAPPLPMSKDQCKDGGWRNFPQFKNQGDCVSFVEDGK